MQLKASLHLHAKEDVLDGKIMNYGIYELIDRANNVGFNILALTTHKKCVLGEEHFKYAASRNILLLPGIEIEVAKKYIFHQDIVLFNINMDYKEEAELIKDYGELKEFKQKYPDVFILAAHPNFGRFDSMGWRNLEKNISLFDGVELSWFYSKKFNLNKKSVEIAAKYGKPVIATSDAHSFDFFHSDFCDIEADKNEAADVVMALKKGLIVNHSQPKKFKDLIRVFGKMKLKNIFYKKSSGNTV